MSVSSSSRPGVGPRGFRPRRSLREQAAERFFTGRYTQLFTVPVEGEPEERLPIPNANRAAFSSDGKRIAYNPLPPQFLQWKYYRGGAVSRIWIYDVAPRPTPARSSASAHGAASSASSASPS